MAYDSNRLACLKRTNPLSVGSNTYSSHEPTAVSFSNTRLSQIRRDCNPRLLIIRMQTHVMHWREYLNTNLLEKKHKQYNLISSLESEDFSSHQTWPPRHFITDKQSINGFRRSAISNMQLSIYKRASSFLLGLVA